MHNLKHCARRCRRRLQRHCPPFASIFALVVVVIVVGFCPKSVTSGRISCLLSRPCKVHNARKATAFLRCFFILPIFCILFACTFIALRLMRLYRKRRRRRCCRCWPTCNAESFFFSLLVCLFDILHLLRCRRLHRRRHQRRCHLHCLFIKRISVAKHKGKLT